MKFAVLTFAGALLMAPSVIFAQTATTAPATPEKHTTINQVKENQQDRIAQGVKAGTLSPAEAAKLEKQEAGINKEEAGMKAQDNGKLTAQDRKTIKHQQKVESKRIYRMKHDIGHK